MKVYAIAVNTFKEAIRDKIFYSLVFFALLILGASTALATLTIGEWSKIIEDLSLSAMGIFGVIISVFVGVGLVFKELEKKTIYTIISKPIKRWQFLLGKYLGLALTLLVYMAVMSIVFMIALHHYGDTEKNGIRLFSAVFLIYIELLVLTAVAIIFSTFSSPMLSAAFTLSIYVIGHLLPDIKLFTAKYTPMGLKGVMNVVYYALPNLENFNIKTLVVHNLPVSAGYIWMATAYGLLYITSLLSIAVLIFEKRNFK